jgi:hypothetical protein
MIAGAPANAARLPAAVPMKSRRVVMATVWCSARKRATGPPSDRERRPCDADGTTGLTTRVVVTVFCPGQSTVYDRVTPHYAGTVSFHGTLSERYVVYGDGVFRLQFNSARFGAFEYVGTFSRDASGALQFFYVEPKWTSTGKFGDNACLTVKHNDDMLWADFEDGVYCPSSAN